MNSMLNHYIESFPLGAIVEFTQTDDVVWINVSVLHSEWNKRKAVECSGLYYVVDHNNCGEVILLAPNGTLIREQMGFMLGNKSFVIYKT